MNNQSSKIRGEFVITPTHDQCLLADGLRCEISVLTGTEFDLDVDLDEDFTASSKVVINFRANRAGWTKTYRRLRSQFKGRFYWSDNKKTPDLNARLRHKKIVEQFRKLNKGAGACVK